jgi:hypothetical protein
VLIDTTADRGIVASNIWSALRDRFFTVGASSVAGSA